MNPNYNFFQIIITLIMKFMDFVFFAAYGNFF